MKRFQLVVVVSMITAGIIWIAYFRSRHTSSAAVTRLIPSDTLALVHLPDLNRARSDLHRTDLYQLWTEPAVQEFLKRPRAGVPANSKWDRILQECESLQMRDLFVALLGIDGDSWKIAAGFQFRGQPEQADKIVGTWKEQLLGQDADAHQETEEYQGHQIQTDASGLFHLASVRDGQWYFFANDAEELKPLLDRADGRNKDAGTTLASDESFSAASKRMAPRYALLTFARLDQLARQWMPSTEKDSGEPSDAFEAIRNIRSLCSATAFEGGKIRDTIFVTTPKIPDRNDITRTSLPIATKDTFLYATGTLDWGNPLFLPGLQGVLGWISNLQNISRALTSNGVSLDDWKSAFESELSWLGDWPSGSHGPSLLVTIPVKDRTKAAGILNLIASADPESRWTSEEKDGVQYFSTRWGGSLFSFSPTIGLSGRMLVAGMDAGSVETAIKRTSNQKSELLMSKNFQNAERAVPPARQAFTYVDPDLIYTRLDTTLRPMLFMAAAFVPGIAEAVDLGKMPQPEVITRHLSPIAMSQSYDGNGYFAESVGPVTFYEMLLGLAWAGMAATHLNRGESSGLPDFPGTSSPPPPGSSSVSPAPSPEEPE